MLTNLSHTVNMRLSTDFDLVLYSFGTMATSVIGLIYSGQWALQINTKLTNAYLNLKKTLFTKFSN